MSNAAKAIQLPEELQAFAARVRARQYASVDDVASAALRLLRRHDERRAEAREELDGIFHEMGMGDVPPIPRLPRAVRDLLKRLL